ncbi:MAG: OFA family MFS transporter [Firmicutes bacterium]|nr:OFA family MFS transporter [Bacillota bacterium]
MENETTHEVSNNNATALDLKREVAEEKGSKKPLARQGLLSEISAIAIQLTLGIAYLWSLFQTGVAVTLFGGNSAQASLTFSLLLATLTIGSVIGGKLATKIPLRSVILLGGVILSLGFFLASFVTANAPWLLWFTYGVMGGVGMGFTYSTTIACAQKWYPHKKGLVTGIIVSALGFGGVIFTPVVEALIKAFGGEGVGESFAFMVLSGIFLVVCSVSSIFLKNPPDNYLISKIVPKSAVPCTKQSYSTSEMLKKPEFYLIIFTFMLACMGGLMIIGFAKPIAVAKGLGDTAYVGVMIISIFNSLGRLTWGIASDKLGRVNTLLILLSGSAVVAPFVILANGYFIYALIALIGFFYGGLLSVFPSLTADTFGAKSQATNYGVVLLGFGAGAIISSFIAGYYKDLASTNVTLMLPAFIISSSCAVAGIAMMLILKYLNKRAELAKEE